mgnify:FL=1
MQQIWLLPFVCATAHFFNLIVQKGLMHIEHIVSKVKAVLQHFKQSVYATAKLVET